MPNLRASNDPKVPPNLNNRLQILQSQLLALTVSQSPGRMNAIRDLPPIHLRILHFIQCLLEVQI